MTNAENINVQEIVLPLLVNVAVAGVLAALLKTKGYAGLRLVALVFAATFLAYSMISLTKFLVYTGRAEIWLKMDLYGEHWIEIPLMFVTLAVLVVEIIDELRGKK